MSSSRSLQGSMNQHLRPEPLQFIDIAAQREAQLAAFSGAKHVVTCASGTDALLMVLMAKGVGRGDAVLCPSFTFCATGEVVALLGATPVFVDVDEVTFNIDANSLKQGIATAKKLGLKPRAVIP